LIKQNVVLLLLVLSLFTIPTEGKTLEGEIDQVEQVAIKQATPQIHMSPAETNENLLFNVVENSGFEEADIYGTPVGYNRYASYYRNGDLAYQGPEVTNGSYAASIKAEGINFSSGSAYISQYLGAINPLAYLSEGQQVDFYYNVLSNPDNESGGFFYVTLELYDTVSYWNLRYYFTSSGTFTNSSSNSYFILGEEKIGEWHYFYRNASRDYEESFGVIPGNLRINAISLYMGTISNPTGVSEVLVDSIRILNATGNNYMRTNWDFELGTGENWGTYKTSPGHISLTDQDFTEGSHALNLTSRNIIDGGSNEGQAYVYQNFGFPDGQYATDYGQAVLEFDWKYNDYFNDTSSQSAFLRIQLQNESDVINVYYLLGRYQNTSYEIGMNSSYYYYFNVEKLGARNTWVHQRIDLYDLFSEEHITDMTIRRVYFYTILGTSEDSYVELLIDDFVFHSDLLRDGGFEQDWYSITTFTAWYTSMSDSYVNMTSDARSGDWAANLTSQSGNYGYLQSSFTPQNVKPGMSTNFWWKLDQSSDTYSTAYYRLSFEGGYTLYYIIAASASYSPTNTSDTLYIFVDGCNDTSDWMNLRRDLTTDLSFLGDNSYNLTMVYLYAYSSGGVMSVRFDDTFFVDNEAPVIASISLDKTPVNYYEQATVIIDTYDELTEVGNVFVYYRNDVSWSSVLATLVDNNYQAIIPALPYGEVVQFYVNSSDVFGSFRIDNNLGVYYTYIVGDDINPLVEIIRPADGFTVIGEITLEVYTEDVGSDVASVEYYADLTLIGTISVAPFELEWDSRMIANGSYAITAVAYDHAGNFISSDAITLIVDNDNAAPNFSQVYLNPTIPQYGQVVEVIASAYDTSSIINVTLYQKIGEGDWNFATMLQDGYLFRGNIIAANYNTEVSYYLKAFDEFEQISYVGSDSEPLSYIVDDLIDPIIAVDRKSTSDTIAGIIDFTISGSDAGSGIASVKVTIDNEVVLQESTLPQENSWDTSEYDNEIHTLLFTVMDNAGNSAEKEVVYTTDNPEGFFETSQVTLGEWIDSYGVFIGAGGVILLWVIGKIFLRRRKKST
jgi:hypothetical protein